jgi:hypothetical protein
MTYRMRPLGLVWAQRLGLALATASSMALVACGGGGSDEAAPTAVSSSLPASMQSVSTDEQTSVTINTTASMGTSTGTATGTTTGTVTMQIMRTAALDFEGKVDAGPSKGTELKGKLQLNAKSTDGGKNFEVTGKLIQRSSMAETNPQLTDAQKEQIKAALRKFYDASKADYEKFRLGVATLTQATDDLLKVQRDAWASVPANATDTAAQYQAINDKVKPILDDFGKKLDALQATLTKDLKALNDTLLAELQAIKPTSGTTTMPDISVTGTLTGDGKTTLTFDLGGGAKIVGTGQTDAKGKFTGTFTGPASGDTGTWSANPILCEPTTPTTPGGTSTMPTPTGTMPTPTGTSPVPTGTMPVPTGTTPTPTGTMPVPTGTTPVPTGTMPTPTGTMPTTPTGTGTVTMPDPGPENCTGRVSVGAEISEVISASVIKVGKNVSIGQYINGIPFDISSAKLVGGTAANFVVGKRVQICSDDTISGITASSAPPLKASTVIFK